MHHFSADATIYLKKKSNSFYDPENMKNQPSKTAHYQPKCFFSVLPISPKSAQISHSIPSKWLTARLLYNDFVCHPTLG